MKFVEDLRIRYKGWKDRRFLQKHRCDDWEQYHQRYDPNVCYPCSRIKDFYKGYPYVFVFDGGSEDIFIQYGDWMQGLTVIKDWAKNHCTEKYRCDIHRVMRDYWSQQWEMNELGGGDYLFFAFKNEMDHFRFALRWG